MADQVKSISATQLSAQIQEAVKKVAATNTLLKSATINAGIGIHPPWILGFVIRNDGLGGKSVADLQGAAQAVLDALPAAKGATPAVAIRGPHIILGYYPDPDITTLHE